MSDSLITIITVMAVVLIMFLVPFAFITNQNEVVVQNEINVLTTTFVNTISKEGKITKSNYNDFIQKVNNTGNNYKIEVEVQILNNYPEDKNNEYYLIGENMYYSEFSNAIEEKLKNSDEYPLKKGDYIKVKVENTNETIGTIVKKFIYGISGREYSVIVSNISSIVEGIAQEDIRLNEPLVPTGDIPQEDVSSDLIWDWDFLWKQPYPEDNPTMFQLKTEEQIEEKIKAFFEEEPSINPYTGQSENISNINIFYNRDNYRVIMQGNNTSRGKGVAWATSINNNIKKIRFSYALTRGDSFSDAGVIFNVKISNNTLSGYYLSLNFSQDTLYNSLFGASGHNFDTFQGIKESPELVRELLRRNYSGKISDTTGAVYEFTYDLGNRIGVPENNFNKINVTKLVNLFDARFDKKF